MLAGDGEHPSRARRGIVNGAHNTRPRQYLAIFGEKQVHHEADYLTRREMLTGRLVGEFGEPADELLESKPHPAVADLVGVQVDAGKFLGDLIKETVLREAVDMRGEVELLEDVPHRRGEALDIGVEVLGDV